VLIETKSNHSRWLLNREVAMPHHHHPHHPPKPHPPGAHGLGHVHRIFSAEKEWPIADVGRLLFRFAESLERSRSIRLREDLSVEPPEPCRTIVRFERTHLGELVFKFELKWGDGESPAASDALDELLGAGEGGELPGAEAS
jgi:hypothetical protein